MTAWLDSARLAVAARPRGLPRTDTSLVRLAWLGMLGLVVALLTLAPATAQQAVPEPDGYRMEEYRAPTPATLAGARVLDTATLELMWRNMAAVLVDVMPRDVKPANLPAGTLWRDKRRDHIPGSVWLPNVGYGALSAEMDQYFRRSLDALTQGRRDRAVVFYCLTDCWMSWNAAKRALSYGYTGVAWYPAGSDGWAKAGLPLEPATPRPME